MSPLRFTVENQLKQKYIIICKETPKMKTLYEIIARKKYRTTVQIHTNKHKKHMQNIWLVIFFNVQ